MHAAALLSLALVVTACGERAIEAAKSGASSPASDGASACVPIETREPNVPEQRPAFPGQTRACAVATDVAFEVIVLAKGLEQPWAVEPLPGGDLLITEKPGRLRIVSAKGEVGEPIAGVPRVLYVVTDESNGQLWKIVPRR